MLMLLTSTNKIFALPENNHTQPVYRDTIVEDIAKEDATIDEIIKYSENHKIKKKKISYIRKVKHNA